MENEMHLGGSLDANWFWRKAGLQVHHVGWVFEGWRFAIVVATILSLLLDKGILAHEFGQICLGDGLFLHLVTHRLMRYRYTKRWLNYCSRFVLIFVLIFLSFVLVLNAPN